MDAGREAWRVATGVGSASLIALSLACGPNVDAVAEDTSGRSTSDTTSSEGTGSASSDATSTGASESSTTAAEPVPGCNEDFDLGLAAGEIAWTREFSSGDTELAPGNAVVVDAAGLVYAAGSRGIFPDRDDAWLHALTPDGAPRWADQYSGDADLTERFSDVALLPTGDVIAVGHEVIWRAEGDGVADSDGVLIAFVYSPTGATIWRTEITAPEGRDFYEDADLAVGADGRILVTAAVEGEGLWPRLFLYDLGPDGDLVDAREHADEDYRGLEPRDVAIDDEGRVYVVADADPQLGEEQEWLGRWDPANAFIGEVTHEHDEASAVAVNPRDGGALLLGRAVATNEEKGWRPFLRRYDIDGVELWTRRIDIDGVRSLDPRGLTTDCDGRALVLADGNGSTWVIRIDDAGEVLDRWGVDVTPYWTFIAIATDPFGNPVLAGSADNAFVVRKIAR